MSQCKKCHDPLDGNGDVGCVCPDCRLGVKEARERLRAATDDVAYYTEYLAARGEK